MANATTPGDTDPRDWLAGVQPPRRRADGLLLLERFSRTTGLEPVVWGKDMIGYGRYAYRYESGRSGEWFMTGFSPRKAAVSVYIMPGYRELGEPLLRLGPHRLGKSCLYLSNLAKVDLDALDEIVLAGLSHLRANYETFEC